ncbi:MAG: TetR/AcrR family transcriptional regulator [Planctomycetota bacterium]|nr:TetR/AcrR family transcriptional regulator [Planctomycetota bacterium]
MAEDDAQLGAKRQAILDAAQGVFDARGYEAATMDEVAQKAGVSKGSLYNHFQNKEDLFAKVFSERLTGDQTELDRLAEEPLPAVEKLCRIMDHVFGRLEFYIGSGRLVMELWAHAAWQQKEGQLAASITQINTQWRKRVEAVLVEGVGSGEFIRRFNPSVMASLIWSTINGIIVESMFNTEAQAGERSLAALKQGLIEELTSWSTSGTASDVTDVPPRSGQTP